jgi:urease accessory protein
MALEPRHLLLLLTWMSPAFPTGGFAYSHGLEWAIESGAVKSPPAVRGWIADVLERGSGWNDAVMFARCWADDPASLNDLALALATSRERHLETTQLGRAFTAAARSFLAGNGDSAELAYPVAAGMACRDMGLPRHDALLAFVQGFAATLTSVAVRLVPLGQTAGLDIIRDLMPVVAATANRALAASLDDLGSITLLSDIAAMNHETLHSRVFRT